MSNRGDDMLDRHRHVEPYISATRIKSACNIDV